MMGKKIFTFLRYKNCLSRPVQEKEKLEHSQREALIQEHNRQSNQLSLPQMIAKLLSLLERMQSHIQGSYKQV